MYDSDYIEMYLLISYTLMCLKIRKKTSDHRQAFLQQTSLTLHQLGTLDIQFKTFTPKYTGAHLQCN